MHADVWGPSSGVYVDGYRYYLSITNDFSRFTWMFPMQAKSEVAGLFLQFIRIVERQFESKVKVVQSDNGGEFVTMAKDLRACGIQARYS